MLNFEKSLLWVSVTVWNNMLRSLDQIYPLGDVAYAPTILQFLLSEGKTVYPGASV